ncbi:MAG: hypothetical protein ACFE96_13905 [Candidatus Hermodarchaeota archaeon]
MPKRTSVIIVLLSIIGLSFVVATPIGILSVNFSSYDSINKSLYFEYLPDTPSEVESLYLNIDYGNVEVDYIDDPVDYFARIDVNIEMGGAELAGKDYSDYFNINEGDKSSSPINFTIRLLSGITESEVEPLIKKISIIVSLRKDIKFNISTNVIHGNVDIEVPFNVRIDNLHVNIFDGDISFNLVNCIIEGDITGIGNQSNIELRTQDIQLTNNSIWYIKNTKGLLKFDIDQTSEMGANVTAIGELDTNNTQCKVYYDDFSSNVGALLTLNQWGDGWFPYQCYWSGFDFESLSSVPLIGYRFFSLDLPTENYFNISLIRNSLDQISPYFWFLSSEPN